MKALSGVRKYSFNDRSNCASAQTNKVMWKCITCNGDNRNFDTIISQAGQDSSIYSVSDRPAGLVRIMKQKVRLHFRNVSNQPAFMSVFIVRAVQRREHSAYYPEQDLMNTLVGGWDNLMVAAQVNNSGTGTVVEYTAGGDECASYTTNLNVSDSKDFGQFYKVIRKETKKLKPADDWWFNFGVPHMDYNGSVVNDNAALAAQGSKASTFAKVTTYCLIKLYGAIGKDTTDDSKIGYMSTDIAYEILSSARTYRLQEYDSTIAMAVPSLDTVATLEAPIDFSEASANQ